jgi:sRNA-binding carbon storage regulator CsrA
MTINPKGIQMPHLVVTRKPGQRIRLMTASGPIWVTVEMIRGDKARIGIEAERSVGLMREELLAPDEQYFAGMTASAQ